MADSPTIKRRQLSAELRRLRIAAGMTVEEAAANLEWSRARLGHIETGRRKRPLVTDIRALLDLYGVTDPRERDAILELARGARETGWWTRYDDVFTGHFPGFEAAAHRICTYEAAIIPGLLQSPAYIREIARVMDPAADDLQVQRVVDSRLERQKVLNRDVDDRLEYWAVIDEAALQRLGTGEMMREQVQHLVEVAENPAMSVTVQVLPIDAGLHAGLGGSFVILDFDEADASPIVYLETDTDGLYLERPREIARYRALFQSVRAAAMNPQESISYLKKWCRA